MELGYDPKIILHLKNESARKSQGILDELTNMEQISAEILSMCGVEWFHVSVMVGATCVDANGIYQPYENRRTAFISAKTLDLMLEDKDAWYHAFDFKKDTPQVAAAVKRAFRFS